MCAVRYVRPPRTGIASTPVIIQRSLLLLLAALAAAAPALAQATAERGKVVYAEQKCANCHSAAGVGNKKGALDGFGVRNSAEDIGLWITNAPEMSAKIKAERKPPMKAYATLPKEDVAALVAYVQSLK
jgi:mono/diheme cytochrome c family protein